MAFAKFMSEPIGRIIQAAIGLALIVAGFFIGGTVGLVIGVFGLAPLAAGVFNFCLLGPLVVGYFSVRKNLESSPHTHGRAPQH